MTILTDTIGEYTSAAGVTIDGVGLKDNIATASGGIVAPIMKNASNSTTGIQLQNAAGTSIVNVDTTNGRVGIGTTAPENVLHVAGTTKLAYEFTSTNDVLRPLVIQRTTTGTPAVGIGAGITFIVEHAGASTDSVAYIDAVASQAFWAGDLAFSVSQGSVPLEGMRLNYLGYLGIGTDAPVSRLHVYQKSSTAAIPVLTLNQADVSEEMIEFTGTIGTGNVIEAVGAKTLTTTHFIRMTITGVGYVYMPVGTIA